MGHPNYVARIGRKRDGMAGRSSAEGRSRGLRKPQSRLLASRYEKAGVLSSASSDWSVVEIRVSPGQVLMRQRFWSQPRLPQFNS